MINNFLNGRNFFNNGFFNRNNGNGVTMRNPYTNRKVADEIAEAKEVEETAATEETEDAAATEQTVPVEAEDEAAADGEDSSETGTGAGSILDQFQDQLNDFLMDSLGLSVDDEGNISFPGGDAGSASGINGLSAYSISAQFELNYSATMAVADANGVSMQQVNFSLSASFEMMGVSAGSGSGFNPFALDSAEGAEGAEENDPLAKMREMFSPEKTAERILNFALSFFGNSEQFEEYGNTEEGRGKFADYIGAAVQKGFDQALGILGDMPKETEEEIDQTHELVFDGFDDFVKNGYNNNNSGLYNSIQSYASTFEMNYSSTSIYWSNDELADMGALNNGRGANAYQALMNRYNQAAGNTEEAAQEEVPVVEETSVDYEA